jgi:acyl-CoA reductase-like NAD-dependent aldehyde dehydrogenase
MGSSLSDRPGTGESAHFMDSRGPASITRHTFAGPSSRTRLPIAWIAAGEDSDVKAAVNAARSSIHGQWGRIGIASRSARLHAVAKERIRRQEERVAAAGARTDRDEEAQPLRNADRSALSITIGTAERSSAHRGAARLEVATTWVSGGFRRDLRTPVGGAPNAESWSRGCDAFSGVQYRTAESARRASRA